MVAASSLEKDVSELRSILCTYKLIKMMFSYAFNLYIIIIFIHIKLGWSPIYTFIL
jgi:hypothetical protein